MATTWTDLTSGGGARDAVAVCTTGTEVAPATGSAVGLLLVGLAGVRVRIEATGAAFTAGTLDAYLQNPVNGKWNRWRAGDQVVPAGSTGETFAYFEIDDGVGRLALVPNGLGQPSEVFIFSRYPQPFVARSQRPGRNP